MFSPLGMGQSLSGLPADMRRIIEKKKITVAMHCDDGFPFFSVDKRGNLAGIDVDLARDMARSLGVEVEFNRQPKTFDEVIDFVADGRADMAISCLSCTRKRAIRVNFSRPYERLYRTLIINRIKTEKIRAGRKPASWLNSPGLLLGTVRGSSYVEYVQIDYPRAQLAEFDSLDEAATNVVNGSLHALIFDDSAVTEWLHRHPEEAIYVQTQVLKDKEDNIAIALNWKDTHLLNWINLYLESYKGADLLKTLRGEQPGDGLKPQE